MATGAGAIGALLSIAIGIRGRTVAVEGNWRANAMDAAVRVLIGVISAAVLFLLLNTGVVTDLQAGEVKFTGADMKWQVAVLFGFAAGFLERLVPDLLEKSAAGSKPPATTPVRSVTEWFRRAEAPAVDPENRRFGPGVRPTFSPGARTPCRIAVLGAVARAASGTNCRSAASPATSTARASWPS